MWVSWSASYGKSKILGDQRNRTDRISSCQNWWFSLWCLPSPIGAHRQLNNEPLKLESSASGIGAKNQGDDKFTGGDNLFFFSLPLNNENLVQTDLRIRFAGVEKGKKVRNIIFIEFCHTFTGGTAKILAVLKWFWTGVITFTLQPWPFPYLLSPFYNPGSWFLWDQTDKPPYISSLRFYYSSIPPSNYRVLLGVTWVTRTSGGCVTRYYRYYPVRQS